MKEACIPADIDLPEPIDPTNCQQQLIDLGISFTPASKLVALVSYAGFVVSSYMVLAATGALPAPLSGGRLKRKPD